MSSDVFSGGISRPKAVTKLDLDLKLFKSGKVREVYDLGETLLFVASDRISAFDVVFNEGIPAKGAVLTRISNYWFKVLGDMVPNHLVQDGTQDLPESIQGNVDIKNRSCLVQKGKIVPMECVVRGYLAGSGWAEYKKTGSACGFKLPSGLREADRLPEPLFTPSTKADVGHDENLTPQGAKDLVGVETYETLKQLSLALYQRGAEELKKKGIILADTKFEFAWIDSKIHLADEVLTPDSSRFWPLDKYEPGASPPSFDKQFVRDYLNKTDWNKQPPPPALPQEVIDGTTDRYLAALEAVTGEDPKSLFQ